MGNLTDECHSEVVALRQFVDLFLATYANTDRNPTWGEQGIVITTARGLRDKFRGAEAT